MKMGATVLKLLMGSPIGQAVTAAVGLAIVGMGVTIWILNGKVDRLQTWQDNIVSVTSHAAHVKGKDGKDALLKKGDVSLQITMLGASVDNLKASLDLKNRESEQRAKDFAESKARAERDRERLDRQFAAAQTSIDRLKAIAANATANSNQQCDASEELMRELEGL